MGELIRDKCQVKLKENQDADSITEVVVLKVNGANGIRELCSSICEIPETGRNRFVNLRMGGWIWGEFRKWVVRTESDN